MREMEALNSGDKKRVLPTWMTAQAPERRMRLGKTPKRRKMAVVAAVRPPAVKTVYCMNEAELVDVALGVLIQVFLRPCLLPSRVGLDFFKSCGEVVGRAAGGKGGTAATDSGEVTCWPRFTQLTREINHVSRLQSRKQEKALEQLPLAGTDKPALSPTCPESPSSGSGSEAEDHGRGAFHSGPSPPGGPQGSGRACSRSPEEEEEDAFKYVREIFFS
ncbi:cell cycle regulator of non-homologous end joining isoform X1 [Phyllostomus discolor]|uniref:Cell cycle regulator of non-homologous end joining isoform X1 n=1 Tax=Phyllostomus discolor TaxID=89673 RepID=A0A7E6CKV6_9CHIR|nr:cell cycle regulator of non-homologous end joining isoform X1 [Phyllostomus discolor]XP_035866824.1 cell cycle regulator of non-homologous end joining isoform X1 [Phyllostomus discolor]XP_035866825.1 cell cycle regulator of non-homologous end joining isoform X1 [Phyllostomus discolor]